MSGSTSSETLPTAGAVSILPKERNGNMFSLPILKHDEDEVK